MSFIDIKGDASFTDCNDAQTGIYRIYDNNDAMKNKPYSDSRCRFGTFISCMVNLFTFQIFIHNSDPVLYLRVKADIGNWSNWKEL